MRIVVLGATGNVGTAVLRRLHAAPGVTDVVGVSRHGPERSGAPYDGVQWHRLDVADKECVAPLAEVLRGADAVIHLVWLIRPNRDRAVMHRTNVDGLVHVLDAVALAGVPHVVYPSSLGAYAPGPKDRPVDESWPLGGVETSHYNVQKAETETILDRFEAAHPQVLVTRLRPGFLFQAAAGPEIHDYFFGPLVPRWLVARLRLPVLPFPERFRFQVLHTDDVADALWRVIDQRAGGAFNVAAEPVVGPDGLARVLGARRVLPVPPALVRAVVALAYRLRLQPTDPGWIDLAEAVPVMDTTRIREVTGWSETVSSLDAIRELLDAAGGPEGLGNAEHRARSPLV
ncbi:epimerase [Kocuria flava]|uniref:Epimerase n=1 Tax=Kocuria flava TaxID=446860 RepID=A0A0U2XLJ1_9MICC|nr:NAD-dependent epimerase/dehydratase family protein [Kocuria flava]ALU39218.1 epimerase [Kocuria flava]GEO91255.1 NAD-dependent epimerase [Kocuria flava]